MAKRAMFFLPILFVIVACLENSACTSLPANFNSVVLTPSSRQVGPNGRVTIGAAVPKDTTNAGVTWTFTPGAGAPVNPGTFGPTTTTQATYTAPPTVTSGFTVTITATSIAIPAEMNSVTITINAPQPLAITTTTLPNGVLGTPYPAGTQLQATGGVTPYTWALAVGSGPLPTGMDPLAANGTIRGTPTLTGTFNFTVKVTDSNTPASTKTANLSITVTNLLNGNYAFEFSGFKAGGTVVVAGSFAADGLGNITAGVEDFNTIAGPPAGGTLETFTGTYTLGPDNRGTLTFNTSQSGTLVYAFVIDSKGLHGRLIEFDSSGIRGSGELALQNTPTCAFNTLSGTGGTGFVIAVSGATGSFPGVSPGAVALAGRFSAEVPASSSTPGIIDNGEMDANVPGGTTPGPFTLSGTFQKTSQAARCTMSISPSSLSTETFSVYPISSKAGSLTEAFIVETDTVAATTPDITVGKLIQQVGFPFTTPSNLLTATSVAGLTGAAIPSGGASFLPFAGIAELTPSGGGAFSMPLVTNFGGTVSTFLGGSAISANLNTGDSFGRVTTNLAGGFVPAFYVIDTNEALFILENPNAGILGILEPQSGSPFAASALNGSFVEGTSAPGVAAVQDFSGSIALANTTVTSGTIAGKQDTSTSAANTAGQTVTGTYNIANTVAGTGTVALTAPVAFTGQFFIVSPTKIAVVSTTAGDSNPVLIFLGQQTDDFGVN
jgi:hypothetical protein